MNPVQRCAERELNFGLTRIELNGKFLRVRHRDNTCRGHHRERE